MGRIVQRAKLRPSTSGDKNINTSNLRTIRTLILSSLCFASTIATALELETPAVGLQSVPIEVSVNGAGSGATVEIEFAGETLAMAADESGRAVFADLRSEVIGSQTMTARSGTASTSASLRVLPGWLSILPAFAAIIAALVLRNVVPALIFGLWIGATTLQGFTPGGALLGLLDVFAVFAADALANRDHVAIILFTMMIGGMVGIITRNGGMASVVRMIVSRARSAVGGQVSVWGMGLIIFFDDYANTLVVGNTARPMTDRLNISREKLAYIVDSTAAPVVCLALVTTWIGYQVSLIDQAMGDIEGFADTTAYAIFLNTIPYSFYPILAVLFVLLVCSTGRDFGPMYRAELRARGGQVVPKPADELPSMQGESLDPKPDIPKRAINAWLPIAVLIGTLIIAMWATGEGETVTDIVGSADPYIAMMWASFISVLVAALMSVVQRVLSPHEVVDAWYGGVRATLFGMIVLVLAWSMSAVTGDLNAKGYLISILGDSMPAPLLPAVVFLLAAVTAFSTGTSWGTMGILVPLVIPLTWAVMAVNGVADPSGMHIMYSAISCVLAGAVWGDHCSPISDTTVLSSIASGCDHIEHVRTQLPYAMLVGAVAIGLGTIPAGYGLSPWVSLLVGAGLLVFVLRYFGRRADD